MLLELLSVGVLLMVIERLIPDQKLPRVPGWWMRVVIVNSLQLGVLLIAALTWERWLGSASVFHLAHHLAPPVAAFVVYLFLTFVYYWWHRVRHDSNFLWLTLHQLHHSASRLETITSFYKHPLEILANALIISLIGYGLFGLDASGAAFVTLYTGSAEFFYHMNIKTPRWVGYILQRPESHRIHHQRGRHYKNFADLPLWDIVFGTFENPHRYDGPCGFKPEREQRLVHMLLFRNVNGPYPPPKKPIA